jgi:molybdopterin synthase sulfur carrier subunit
MAVKVKVPVIMRSNVGGRAAVEGEGSTLRELLEDLDGRFPGFASGVLGDQGGLHRFVNVYVNGEDVRYLGALDAEVTEGDTVSILPAVVGG